MLTLLSNPLCSLLAGMALVSYVMIYTPLKRVSSYNTLVGAFPGAMPPLIGWTTATYSIDLRGFSYLHSCSFGNPTPCDHHLSTTRIQQCRHRGSPSVQGLESTVPNADVHMCAPSHSSLLFLTRVSG